MILIFICCFVRHLKKYILFKYCSYFPVIPDWQFTSVITFYILVISNLALHLLITTLYVSMCLFAEIT
jgi:hypothetical protein